MSSHAHWQGVLHLGLIFACVLFCEGGLLEFLTTLKQEGEAAHEGIQHPQGLIEFPALDEMNSEERESNRQRARKVATIIEKNVHMLANDMLQMWAITRTDTDEGGDLDEEFGEEEDEGHKDAGAEEQEGGERGPMSEDTKQRIGQGMNRLEQVAKSLLQDETDTVKDKGDTEAIAVKGGEEAKLTKEENRGEKQENIGLNEEKSSSLVKESENHGSPKEKPPEGPVTASKEGDKVGSQNKKVKGNEVKNVENSEPIALEERSVETPEGLKANNNNGKAKTSLEAMPGIGSKEKSVVAETILPNTIEAKSTVGAQLRAKKERKDAKSEYSKANTLEETDLETSKGSKATNNNEVTKTILKAMPDNGSKEKSVVAGTILTNTVKAKSTEEAQVRVQEISKEVKSEDSEANTPKETNLETPEGLKDNNNNGKNTDTSSGIPGNGGTERAVVPEKISSNTVEVKATEKVILKVNEGTKDINKVEQMNDSVVGRNNRPVMKEGKEVKNVLKNLIHGTLNKRPLEKPKETRRGKYVISDDLKDLDI